MEAAGFTPEDYAGDDVEVWPENWPAWVLFCEVSTQWRTGMNGPTGLDYSVVFRLMDEEGLKGQDWRGMLQDIRVIESAALVQMRAE